MPVEGTNTIAGLQTDQPQGGDPVSDSDNHHRQMKEVLKNIFGGQAGQGFAIPITATEAQLNWLSNITEDVKLSLDTLSAAVATKIASDGSAEFTGTVGGVAAAVDTDFVRAVDFASQTLGGTLKVRYNATSKILYLSNDDAVDP